MTTKSVTTRSRNGAKPVVRPWWGAASIPEPKPGRRRLRRSLFWGMLAAVPVALFTWGCAVERRRFTLRYETVPVLPPGSKPLRILHLSDLHLAPWQRDKQVWLRRLGRLKPDLIINTGDNLGHRDALPALRRTLRVFRGVPGVFVSGSNDSFAPSFKNPLRYFWSPSARGTKSQPLDTEALRRFFTEELKWTDLNNSSTALKLNGVSLKLLGVDDPHLSYDKLEQVLPLAINEQDTVIAVTHAPYRRILDAFVTAGAQMIFAGHTHGGQVCLPGVGALVTNCDLPRYQARGLSSWTAGDDSAWLQVSAGVGTSIYAPIRFACRPEAVMITLI